MKTLTITIDKRTVISEVSLASAYAGAKLGREKDDFTRVATVEEDALLLDLFWADACGETADVLKEFVAETESGDDSFRLRLEVSGSYDDSLTPSLERDIASSIAAGVAARWFRFTLPKKASEWEERAGDILRRAHAKICSRRPPIRETKNEETL